MVESPRVRFFAMPESNPISLGRACEPPVILVNTG